ncbi:hypothetical protein [Streptomyces spiralis]|uniref:zinc finger domain-containing protein n=1 Tax=Streptomyces spiralis TaxID=66376 RepID=UPI003690C247
MTDHPEWAIPCPWCHAQPWQRCTGHRGRRIAIPSHDARITAWNAQQAPQTGDAE